VSGKDPRLARLADAVLLPCFDGTSAPEWVRRRVAGSLAGVCLFARNVADVDQVAALSAELAAERESVVISIDEEAGDVTRLDAATGSRFPGAAALGRVDDPALTERIAEQVGDVLVRAGVSVNFAPCADVAVDPSNPVIGSRAFGSDTDLVARHTVAWVTGQQRAGVAASTKHFPGHGDTAADSHRSAAVLHADRDTLWAQAIPPFREAVRAGTASIMAGHLLAPAVDDLPASVSRRWLTATLRGELGFDGAIVTDALEMAAVAGPYGIAGAAVRALAAGADLLCLGGDTRPPEEIDSYRDAIVDAVRQGHLAEERLADAAARCETLGLAAAHRLGPAPSGIAPADGGTPFDDAASREASARALQVAGDLPALRDPVLVVRCADPGNIAIGAIPWGPAPLLAAREILVGDGDVPSEGGIRAAATVLVVTRDRHRHPWMRAIVDGVRRIRPDAVLVEMGISGVSADDGPAIASYGATLANARAVVESLRG
jgi:beta-N-acetylhexosaminidase